MDKNFVSLEHIYKVYPNGIEAVHDFNLDIKKHEFIVIVGPSGCGKSTTLRMVAGLEDITEGRLLIDGDLANDETPKDRNIAMVFQSYSLYPHMTVKDNISFGIRMRTHPFPVLDKEGNPVKVIDEESIKKLTAENAKLNRDLLLFNKLLTSLNPEDELEKVKYDTLSLRIENVNKQIEENIAKIEDLKANPIDKIVYRRLNEKEIDERVDEVAKILELEEYLSRKPAELSGGQRQRVALGRAIIRNAKVFLMDEPLSNLDAKLRGTMRSEIIKLHQKLNATIIYVTHDQTEAMTMASRIVVMKDGFIQQIGTPNEIYQNPSNTFVANFIGSPAMNIIPASLDKKNVVLPNGFKIAINKPEQSKIKEFYENQIKEYGKLLNRINTDVEELAISAIKALRGFVKSNYANVELMPKKTANFLAKPLADLFDKFLDQFKILKTNEDLDKKELQVLENCLTKSKAAALRDYINGLDNLKELEYFNASSENELLKEVLLENKEHFESFIALANIISAPLKEAETKGCLYVVKALNALEALLNRLNKDNKEELVNACKALRKEVETNVVINDVDKAFDEFEKLLNKVNSISDSDIRTLYFTCVKTRGNNKNIDWMLSIVDKSNMSKKMENKLRNEFLIATMIKGLISLFTAREEANGEVLFGLRPEDIHEKNENNIAKYGSLSFKFEVAICELLGKEYILHLDVNSSKDLVCQLPNDKVINANDKIELVIDYSKIHLFDSITEKVIF